MSELYSALLHMRGTYIYGAARADSVLEALAAMADRDDAEADPADVLNEHAGGFVDHWIDGVVDRFGDYAFVAEVRLEGETEIGWADQGSLPRAAHLFTRAAEDARDGVDGSDD